MAKKAKKKVKNPPDNKKIVTTGMSTDEIDKHLRLPEDMPESMKEVRRALLMVPGSETVIDSDEIQITTSLPPKKKRWFF